MRTKDYDLSKPVSGLADELLGEVLKDRPELQQRHLAAVAAGAEAQARLDQADGERQRLRAVRRGDRDETWLLVQRHTETERRSAAAALQLAQTELATVRREIAPLVREHWKRHSVVLKGEYEELEEQIKAIRTGALREADRRRHKWSSVSSLLEQSGFVTQ